MFVSRCSCVCRRLIVRVVVGVCVFGFGVVCVFFRCWFVCVVVGWCLLLLSRVCF